MSQAGTRGRPRWPLLMAAAGLLLFGFVGPVLVAAALRVDTGILRVKELDGLATRFATENYVLKPKAQDELRVPRLFVAELPRDWGSQKDVKARKRAFIKVVLPLVLRANARLHEDRARLKGLAQLAADGEALPPRARRWLTDLAERYDAGSAKPRALLRHVDVVPPSLAIAQAAIESGWGTSRFARQANALFGQWTTADDADGLIPRARAASDAVRVRAFDSLAESTAAYMRNLNRHRAYRTFRARRAAMRVDGRPLDPLALARTLTAYSERGEPYVRDLITIIRHNDLRRFDDARLAAVS